MRFKRVGVLMGGLSAEREISLRSGHAVASGLERSGYDAVEIDLDRGVAQRLADARLDAVFIALHGRLGEDGTVQGLLEILGIPYTGSSVLASALCMDKIRTREILAAHGLPIADGFLVSPSSPHDPPRDWSLPCVVKPANEGSSVGVTIVHQQGDYAAAVERALAHSSRVLVERFVAGMETTVAVLDGDVLGALEIEPHREFYDYSAKYDSGGSSHHVPPRLPRERISELENLGARAYAALGCSGAARIDFITPTAGTPIILEANTIPGMTEVSLLPEIAGHAGLSFEQLVGRIMEGARLHVR